MAFKPMYTYPPFAKLLVFTGLVFVHMLLFSMFSMLAVEKIWGIDLINNAIQLQQLNNPRTIAILKFIQVLSQVGMLVGGLLFVRLTYAGFANPIQWAPAKQLKNYIWAICLIIIAMPVISFLAEINSWVHFPQSLQHVETWLRNAETDNDRIIEAFLTVPNVWGLYLNIALIALFTAIVEEVIFRGILLNELNSWFKNTHLAVIVSGIIFACIHMQFFKSIPMIAMGVLFGYLYVWTRTIWIPIVVHFVNNTLTIVFFYFIQKGSVSKKIEDFGTQPSDWPYVLAALIAVILIIRLFYKQSKQTAISS